MTRISPTRARIAMVFGLLAGFLFATSTQAAPINALEADFGGDFYGQLVGTLDVGINSVSGNLGSQDPGDSFQLMLGSGYNINSVGLTFSNFAGFGGFSAISALGGGPTGGASFTFTLEPVPTLEPVASSYEVKFVVTQILNTSLCPGSLPPGQDEECRTPSNPIPEPSAALVFGLGALVVGMASRRRVN